MSSSSQLKRIKTQQNSSSRHNRYSQAISSEKSNKSHCKLATTNANSHFRNILDRFNHDKKREIKVDHIVLNQKDDYLLRCNHHPQKQACFEDKQTMQHAFCHECAIDLVNQGWKLTKLSEQNLKIRQIYEEQTEKLQQNQAKAHFIVSQYFTNQRERLIKQFLLAKEKSHQNKVNLEIFSLSSKTKTEIQEKTKELFGALKPTIIQFSQKDSNKQKKAKIVSPYYSKQSYSPFTRKNNSFGYVQNVQSAINTKCENKENYETSNFIDYSEQISQTAAHTQRMIKDNEIIPMVSISKWKKKTRIQSNYPR